MTEVNRETTLGRKKAEMKGQEKERGGYLLLEQNPAVGIIDVSN